MPPIITRVDVYLDSLERKERWIEHAEEAGDSVSKFVQKAVEYAIEQGGPDFGELGERANRIEELEAQVSELQEELKQKEIVIEKLQDDLREHQYAPFTEDEFEGSREYDVDLVEVLRSADTISDAELCQRLGIEPTDTEKVEGLDAQLQQLEAYGLVVSTPRGWRWTE